VPSVFPASLSKMEAGDLFSLLGLATYHRS
jgi:hypothetical protein